MTFKQKKRPHRDRFVIQAHPALKQPAEKQQAEHKDHHIDNYFDKAHKIPYSGGAGKAKSNSIPLASPMSKTSRFFRRFLFAAFLSPMLWSHAMAQDLQITIKFDETTPQKIKLVGKKLKEASRDLSFLKSVGGVDLTNRISNLELFDINGQPVKHMMLVPGEYLASADFRSWTSEHDISSSDGKPSTIHASWISGGAVALMLDDLLPRFAEIGDARSANVVFEMSYRWVSDMPPATSIYTAERRTTEKRLHGDTFYVSDIAKSVFYIGLGMGWLYDNGMQNCDVSLLTGWSTLVPERGSSMVMPCEIFDSYRQLFQTAPSQPLVAVFPHPVPGRWEGETRGKSITIFSSNTAFPSQAGQQRHEQLRHEMFHLWIPEGVNLTGSYDWFYEGFALYQALKLGVNVNRIRFDDYLDTLARTFDIERRQAQRLSLIDASRSRWTGENNTTVYARGMLVAFLCDMAMLEASKGKRSTDDVVREVYKRHSGTVKAEDGNEAVIKILRENKELSHIVERFVLGVEPLDLTAFIKAAGIEAETVNNRTRLKVVAKPSGGQKRILDKLGYNNWRKLAKGN